MAAAKLQFFFVSRPFQDFFFLVREKAVALLVDLVKDLVDSLLRDVRDLFKWLGAGNLVVKLVFRGPDPLLLVRVEEVIEPVEDLVHPYAAVVAPPKLVNKKESGRGAGQVGNIGAGIAMSDAGEVNKEIQQRQDPQRDPAVDHRENAIVRRYGGDGDGKGHYCCIRPDEPGGRCRCLQLRKYSV